MTLGQRISRYRRDAELSQEELGARLGVSRQAVSKWENDLATPDMTNLLGLAREFGISVAELTDTPEIPVCPAENEPAAEPHSPAGTAVAQPVSRRRKLIRVLLAILIAVLAVLILNASRTQRTPAPGGTVTAPDIPAQEAPAQVAAYPETDFALLLDWTEDGEFLELGQQTEAYPFGAPPSIWTAGRRWSPATTARRSTPWAPLSTTPSVCGTATLRRTAPAS